MNETLAWVIVVPAAYLIGAIPNGIWVCRLWRGIDIRQYGSGGSGATNVLRTVGKPAAAVVLILDFAKGSVAVLIATWLANDNHLLVALAGAIAVAGHTWPVYVGFKGGKGIATGWGALLVLSPIATAATVIGIVIAATTRYVSLGSIIGAVAGVSTLVVLAIIDRVPLEYVAFVVPSIAFILFSHTGNIRRLLEGRERRLEAKSRPERAPSDGPGV